MGTVCGNCCFGFMNTSVMINKLASKYNNASSEEEGLAAINKDPMLDKLALLFPGGEEEAIKAVLNAARAQDRLELLNKLASVYNNAGTTTQLDETISLSNNN